MLVLRTLSLFVFLGLSSSASALVASSFERRDGAVVGAAHGVHRRHAHAPVLPRAAAPLAQPDAAPAPVSPAPGHVLTRKSIAERRALRQKRCAARGTPSSSASPNVPTDVPVNVGNNPIPPPPAPTSTQQAQPQPQPPSNSGGDTFTGQLTFYDIGLGACGWTNNNGEMVAAVSHLLYDGFDGYWGTNPNNNPICGKKAVIHFEGKEITVTIVDRCEGCALHDVDLSPTAFNLVADPNRGRLDGATWHFA